MPGGGSVSWLSHASIPRSSSPLVNSTTLKTTPRASARAPLGMDPYPCPPQPGLQPRPLASKWGPDVMPPHPPPFLAASQAPPASATRQAPDTASCEASHAPPSPPYTRAHVRAADRAIMVRDTGRAVAAGLAMVYDTEQARPATPSPPYARLDDGNTATVATADDAGLAVAAEASLAVAAAGSRYDGHGPHHSALASAGGGPALAVAAGPPQPSPAQLSPFSDMAQVCSWSQWGGASSSSSVSLTVSEPQLSTSSDLPTTSGGPCLSPAASGEVATATATTLSPRLPPLSSPGGSSSGGGGGGGCSSSQAGVRSASFMGSPATGPGRPPISRLAVSSSACNPSTAPHTSPSGGAAAGTADGGAEGAAARQQQGEPCRDVEGGVGVFLGPWSEEEQLGRGEPGGGGGSAGSRPYSAPQHPYLRSATESPASSHKEAGRTGGGQRPTKTPSNPRLVPRGRTVVMQDRSAWKDRSHAGP